MPRNIEMIQTIWNTFLTFLLSLIAVVYVSGLQPTEANLFAAMLVGAILMVVLDLFPFEI